MWRTRLVRGAGGTEGAIVRPTLLGPPDGAVLPSPRPGPQMGQDDVLPTPKTVKNLMEILSHRRKTWVSSSEHQR